MSVQRVFARYEIKYLITKTQLGRIKAAMAEYMNPDEFGRSDICSVYFDTPSYILIRRSLDSPVYKEKLRLRSYGVASPDSIVYAEIKKKFDSVVYKRRVGMPIDKAELYLGGGWKNLQPVGDQISRELDFMLRRYAVLEPAAFVSCEREAFYAKDDREFRVTFDENIFGRDFDLTLDAGIYGIPLIGGNQALMEIKTGSSIPKWMCSILSSERIFKSQFSKYGTVYMNVIAPKHVKNIINGVDKDAAGSFQWIV